MTDFFVEHTIIVVKKVTIKRMSLTHSHIPNLSKHFFRTESNQLYITTIIIKLPHLRSYKVFNIKKLIFERSISS